MAQSTNDLEWHREQIRLARKAVAQAVADNGPNLPIELPVLRQSLLMLERSLAEIEAGLPPPAPTADNAESSTG